MNAGVDRRHDATLLRQHLSILLPLLQEGARRGLHRGLRHLHRAEIQALLDTATPRYSVEESGAAFHSAGETLVYGALVLAYAQRVGMLDALSEDTIADKARLRRCLASPSPAAMDTPVPSWPQVERKTWLR